MKLPGGPIEVRALEDAGVPFTFGIPGTHNIELYDALGVSDSVRPVLVTDEQSASFMADGLWRATGRLGCVNVVPGAGLTHALSGIAEAFLDQVPMLVLGCGIRRDSGRSYQLHDVDQAALAAPVVKAVFRPGSGAEAYAAVREAARLARELPGGPVFVEVPAEVYLFRHEVPDDLDGKWRSGALLVPRDLKDGAIATRTGVPDAPVREAIRAGIGRRVEGAEEGADAVAALLSRWQRPVLYLGAGAAGVGYPLVELAERLGSPVATTFQGKGVFPEGHPLWLWPGFGAFAPEFAREVAASCDGVLAVGCRFSEVGTGSYGLEMPGPLIHVDVDPEVHGRNYEAELAVTAEAGAFCHALLERLDPSSRRETEGLRQRIAEGLEGVANEMRAGSPREDRVTPAVLLDALQSELGPSAVFTADSGNGTFLAMEGLRLDRPGCFLAPVDFSCMGYSVPAALGAALGSALDSAGPTPGDPPAPVVALAGDGAFLMTGLELLTAEREGMGVMVFLLRDRELAQISQFQGTALNRKVSSALPPYDAEGLAAGMGVAYRRMDSDHQARKVVAEAASLAREGRPVLVEVAIDYSRRTWFTRGVVKTNLGRLPLADRLRLVGRALVRRVTG